MEGDDMRTLESRLRELVESTKYKKDFKELKNSILSSEKPDEIIFKSKNGRMVVQNSAAASVYWSGKRSDIYFVDHGIVLRGEITPLTLKKVRTLLKKGNLNDHYLEIPYVYSDFKTKYKLKYFFDPGRVYPQGFDPFHDIPVSVHSSLDGRIFAPFLPDPSNTNNDDTKVLIMVDITYPLKVLEKEIKVELLNLKKIWKLKEERKGRYSDDEIYKIKGLMKEGMKAIEIFRRLHPEHRDFNSMKDYVLNPKEDRKLSDYDAWKAYKRTLMVMKKAKTRKN
jgi:hypothetical protein